MVIVAAVRGTFHQQVWDELTRQAPDFGAWVIDPADEYDYGDRIRQEWRGDSDLVLVEQDVVPPRGSIMALLDCPKPWCAHEVDLGGHFSARTLGLVKFSRSLQLAYSALARSALPWAGSGRPPVHWRSVDSALTRYLDFAKVPLHVHQPPAQHLHRYPASPPAGPAPATPGRPA